MLLAQPFIDPSPSFSVFGVSGWLLGILLVLYFPVGCAILTSWLAGEKGRSGVAWFFVGLFLGPIALLAVGLSPDDRPHTRVAATLGIDPYAPPGRPPNIPPPAPPAPRAQPVAPGHAVAQPTTTPASMQIDVDAAVFHEGTQTGYARGRTADGTLVYVRLPDEARVRDLSDQLLTARPFRTSVAAADIVPVDQLPPELRG